MGYPLLLALRYLGSKKGASVSAGTFFAVAGVALGVAALAIVMSVTGGFQEQFREKVLGVNAHVIVLKYAPDFRDYREVMAKVEAIPGVEASAPFVINPMMVTHEGRSAAGVLLKGVDPERMPKVLDLPRHIVEGSLEGLRRPGAKAPEKRDPFARPSPAPGPSPAPSAPPAPKGDEPPAPEPSSPLLQQIKRQIDEDDAAARAAKLAGAAATATATATGAADPPSVVQAESAVPTGGYASQLPTDDELPEVYDPDPCRHPDQVAGLPGAVIGRSLARRLGLALGDCLQITSPAVGLSFGASGSRPPVMKQFRVIAVFEAGFDQYDSKLLYTDLFEAQAFYDQGDSVTGVEMKVHDIDQAAAIAKQVDGLLSNGVFHTTDWRELNRGLFTALLIQQILMSVVLALIIVVAAFTVIATLIMIVLEKRKEIALLKALGARDDAVLRVFLYQGGLIGLVGTSIGLVLGYLGCKGLLAWGLPLDPKVYFISKLPVNLRPTEFLVTGAIAIAICLVATVFPATYAARLRPSDGLRVD